MKSIAPSTVTPIWPSPLSALIAELKQRAKTCETASEDLTEAALTGGETSDKEKNTQDAKEWQMRASIWLEAEALARGFAEAPTPPAPQSAPPAPCI